MGAREPKGRESGKAEQAYRHPSLPLPFCVPVAKAISSFADICYDSYLSLSRSKQESSTTTTKFNFLFGL